MKVLFAIEFLLIGLLITACSSETSFHRDPDPDPTRHAETLSEVRAINWSGRYFVEGCERYEKLGTQKKVLVVFATAQEAELSGYEPASSCVERVITPLKLERSQFGELKATPETEMRKLELSIAKKIQRLEQKQSVIEDSQRDLEEKQEEVDEILHR